VAILACPSQGDYVVLEDAAGRNFEFLSLNARNPPRRRLADQKAEDEFANQLLLLGAKW
ncbi:hypothetical protein EJ08DRAFT_594857, partial [Tothia fuscella]